METTDGAIRLCQRRCVNEPRNWKVSNKQIEGNRSTDPECIRNLTISRSVTIHQYFQHPSGTDEENGSAEGVDTTR